MDIETSPQGRSYQADDVIVQKLSEGRPEEAVPERKKSNRPVKYIGNSLIY